MFEAALETVLDALKPRLQSGETWRASATALHALAHARKSPSGTVAHAHALVSDSLAPVPKNMLSHPGAADVSAQRASAEVLPEGGLDRETRLIRLRELEEKTGACRACAELAGSRTHVVQGGGDVEADVLFAEEAPSVEQDAAGHVAAGEASDLLEKMLKAMGLSRSAVFVVNVVRCMPPAPAGETVRRKPQTAELDACRGHVEELVRIVRPRVIVALGAGAARGLLGTQDPVARLRSRWHAFLGIPVMPTFHPAYLIENPDISNKRKVWEDLLLVMEKLELPVSAKQRAFFLR